LKQADNAGAPDAARYLVTTSGEPFGNQTRRALFVVAKLRVRVNVAPVGDQLLNVRRRKRQGWLGVLSHNIFQSLEAVFDRVVSAVEDRL
jgi:hypothetical protein